MKDNFSEQSSAYSQFRPGYPDELITFLLQHCKKHRLAWDCGTGNGQLAIKLAEHFDTVYGTDISSKQLNNAQQKENIIYIEKAAELTDFDDEMFDLITVAQAIHWFNFDPFYTEVKRCLQPHGIFAVVGYGLMQVNEEVDRIILHFYQNIIGSYWDKERRYIDEAYMTIPFPFAEIEAPKFVNSYEWNFDQLIGYLSTWSAVQHYMQHNNVDPVNVIKDNLKKVWGEETHQVHFDILLRCARK